MRNKKTVLVSNASDSTIAMALQRTLTTLATNPKTITRANLDTLAD
jgi:hypothetical protein